VQFIIGGKVREPLGMIRCNSGTDGKVRMREGLCFKILAYYHPEEYRGDFCWKNICIVQLSLPKKVKAL